MAKAARTPRSTCVTSSAKLAFVGTTLTPVRDAIQVVPPHLEKSLMPHFVSLVCLVVNLFDS